MCIQRSFRSNPDLKTWHFSFTPPILFSLCDPISLLPRRSSMSHMCRRAKGSCTRGQRKPTREEEAPWCCVVITQLFTRARKSARVLCFNCSRFLGWIVPTTCLRSLWTSMLLPAYTYQVCKNIKKFQQFKLDFTWNPGSVGKPNIACTLCLQMVMKTHALKVSLLTPPPTVLVCCAYFLIPQSFLTPFIWTFVTVLFYYYHQMHSY